MSTRVIPFYPRPNFDPPSPSRPGVVLSYTVAGHISVLRDETRALYVAVCERCCDGMEAERADQADDWAESHRCDPELAALLDQMTRRAA